MERNPPKYDSEGDELDEEDAEEHADPEMADENPFGDIHLEGESSFSRGQRNQTLDFVSPIGKYRFLTFVFLLIYLQNFSLL